MSARTVLLISANDEVLPYHTYPLALAKLAASVEQEGHRAVQYDVLVHGRERLAQTLLQEQPDLVGLSLRNIDTVDSSRPCGFLDLHQEMVQQIRACTDAPIVLGGSGFSIFPQELMALHQADFGVVGPGERPLVALLNALDQGDSLSAIAGVCTQASPRPAPPHPHAFASEVSHDPALIEYYWRKGGMIGLQTKQGCPHRCTYCTYPLIEGRDVRCGDPEALAGQVERIAKEHGVTYFFVVDSVFNTVPEAEMSFAEALCRHNLDVSWGAFFSPAGITQDYLETLKRSGLTHVEFGTDSLSDAVLATYGKEFCVSDVINACALVEALDIHCAHYIILGGPGETPGTIRETMSNTHRMKRCVYFPFAGIRVYPNTPLHEQAIADGGMRRDQDLLHPVFYFAPGLDAERIWRCVTSAEMEPSSWLFPFESHIWLPLLQRLRERGLKGPLWEYSGFRPQTVS